MSPRNLEPIPKDRCSEILATARVVCGMVAERDHLVAIGQAITDQVRTRRTSGRTSVQSRSARTRRTTGWAAWSAAGRSAR